MDVPTPKTEEKQGHVLTLILTTSMLLASALVVKCVSFWLHGCCGKWEGFARKLVNHTSCVDVVTPTDRP